MSVGRTRMRRAMEMILVATMLEIMAVGIVMPVLPVLIRDLTGSLKAASLWTGIIGSLWAVLQLLCAPVIGALLDRFGRQPVLGAVLCSGYATAPSRAKMPVLGGG